MNSSVSECTHPLLQIGFFWSNISNRIVNSVDPDQMAYDDLHCLQRYYWSIRMKWLTRQCQTIPNVVVENKIIKMSMKHNVTKCCLCQLINGMSKIYS